MLQRQLVFAHLRKNRTDVEVDVTRVRNLEAVINSLLGEVKVAVLNLKSFLKELQGRPQFLGSPEDARKVVVGDSAVPVTFFRVGLCLLQ